MRLIDLVRGVMTGYGVRGLQVVISLLMLPFLIRDDVLGVERYGQAFVILSSIGAVSIVTDGIKLGYSRVIAAAIQDPEGSPGVLFGQGLRVMLLLTVGLAGLLFFFRNDFIHVTGLPATADCELAIALAALRLVAFEAFWVNRSLLLGHGHLGYLNGVQAVEVVSRNAFYLIAFSLGEATIAAFVGAQAVGAAFKEVAAFAYALRHHRTDLNGAIGARVADSWPVLKESFSIGMTTIFYIILYRLSLPLVNRVLGSEAAGYLALVINTTDYNLRQALLVAVQPLLVPIASRLNIDKLSAHRRFLLLEFEATYGAAVLLFTAPLITLLPALLELWLGAELGILAGPMQIMLVGAAIQICFTVQHSLLVGQRMAPLVARRTAPISVAAIGLGIAAVITTQEWAAVAVTIAVYSAMTSAFAVGRVFETRLLLPEARHRRVTLRLISACVVSFGLAAFLSRFASLDRLPWLVIAALGSFLGTVATIHFTLLPIRRIRETLSTLARSRGRDLFSDR